MKTKKSITLKQECDKLWADLIKKRAGYCSEYSGKAGKQIGGDEILHAHHLVGKPNLRLRYLTLENGICLTAGEHKFIAHHTGRQETFRDRVKNLRGDDIFDRLKPLRSGACKTNLNLIKLWLESEIKNLNP